MTNSLQHQRVLSANIIKTKLNDKNNFKKIKQTLTHKIK